MNVVRLLLLLAVLPAVAKEPSLFIACELIPITRQRQVPVSACCSGLFNATSQSTSRNWSGYVVAPDVQNPTVTSVSRVYGTWNVPTLYATSRNAYAAIWVGIDGYGNGTVEQIGTAHEWFNGRPVHYAWFEMFPSAAFRIGGFPVHVGDSISASSTYEGNGVFRLAIFNHTRNVHTVIPRSRTTRRSAQRISGEWIVEAPSSSASGGILPLAHFSQVRFRECSATVRGRRGSISNSNWENVALRMVTSNGATKAVPTALFANGTRFNVTWKHM